MRSKIGPKEDDVKTLVYTIPNISCAHCVHTIKMEVGEIAGVQSVEGDEKTKKVTITYEDPAAESQIVEVLKEINYPPQA